jgi:hypothetical protein
VGSRLRLWSSDLLKDTVVWAVGPAVASYLNVSNIERRPRFFRRAALGAVKYSVFVEFYVNLYVFNFLVELVLVPLITMLALLSFVAGREKRTRIVKQVFDLVLGLIGIGLVVFVTVNVIVGWRQVDRLHNLRELLLPIWLTIGVLLFLYGLSLYSNYQQAFLRLKFATSDRRAVRRGKFALASVLHFRTRAVSSFAWPWLGQLASAESLGDARRIVKDFARRDHLLNDKSDESTQNAVDGNGDGNADEP